MATSGYRLLRLDSTYGYPTEVSLADTVQLPTLNLTGVGGVGIQANGQTITGLPTPVAASDATTKQYVDGLAMGISVVGSVLVLSKTNIASLSGLAAIDGVTPVDGSRVLLTGQSDAKSNGIWIAHSSAWTRPTASNDLAVGASAAGKYTYVEQGSTYANEQWACTSSPGSDVVGTSPLSWTQINALGDITVGAGLSKGGGDGNTIMVNLAASSGLQFTSNSLDTFLQPSGSLTKDTTGLGIQLSGTTLSNSGSGLKVLGVPANFTIAGNAVDANFTATAANNLVDGPTVQADGLHTHLSVLRAQATAAVHTNGATACAAGDPVVWSTTGNQLARADAAASTTPVVIGVLGVATAANGSGVVYKEGIAPGVLSGATPGSQVWLNVGGGYTQSVPTASGAYLVQLGVASSATDLDVKVAYVGRRAAS